MSCTNGGRSSNKYICFITLTLTHPSPFNRQRKSRAKDPTNPRIPSIKIPLRIKGVVRNKWGGIIRTCGIDGCEYKIGNPNHMKSHKAAKHNVNVRWFSCDQAGCDYKAKQVRSEAAVKFNLSIIFTHNFNTKCYMYAGVKSEGT